MKRVATHLFIKTAFFDHQVSLFSDYLTATSKRLFDVVMSALGLIVVCPLLIVAGLLIKLTSPGPVIFSQTRVGKSQRSFTLYKLRTMRNGTREAGTHEIESSAITAVGKVMRAVKLDELPQLWNVLIGDMSLVGPRPCLPMQSELIDERAKRGVFELMPGITGLAQVEDLDMSDPVQLAKKDAEYIERQTFGGDLYVILQTLIGRGLGDRAMKSRDGKRQEVPELVLSSLGLDSTAEFSFDIFESRTFRFPRQNVSNQRIIDFKIPENTLPNISFSHDLSDGTSRKVREANKSRGMIVIFRQGSKQRFRGHGLSIGHGEGPPTSVRMIQGGKHGIRQVV